MASPYPVLISAEVHCGLEQQDKIVDIMIEAFGDSLIQAPIDGRPKIQALPSPEDLKYKILLKVGFRLSIFIFLLLRLTGSPRLKTSTSQSTWLPFKLPVSPKRKLFQNLMGWGPQCHLRASPKNQKMKLNIYSKKAFPTSKRLGTRCAVKIRQGQPRNTK